MLAKRFPRLETPTVRVSIETLERDARGVAAWGVLEVPPPAEEYVYTAGELRRTLVAYGAAVGVMMSRSHAEEFRLVAHGMFTGRLLGLYHLQWCPAARRFLPANQGPMTAWPPVEELPLEVLAGAAIHAMDPIPFPGGPQVIHHPVASAS